VSRLQVPLHAFHGQRNMVFDVIGVAEHRQDFVRVRNIRLVAVDDVGMAVDNLGEPSRSRPGPPNTNDVFGLTTSSSMVAPIVRHTDARGNRVQVHYPRNSSTCISLRDASSALDRHKERTAASEQTIRAPAPTIPVYCRLQGHCRPLLSINRCTPAMTNSTNGFAGQYG